MILFRKRNFINPILSLLLICFGILALFLGKEIILLTNIILGVLLIYISVELIFLFIKNKDRIIALVFGIVFLAIAFTVIMNQSDVLTRITFASLGITHALVFTGKYFFDKIKNKIMPSVIFKINMIIEIILVALSLVFTFSFLLKREDLGLVLGIYFITIGAFFIYLFILQLIWEKKHPVNITQNDLQKYISR